MKNPLKLLILTNNPQVLNDVSGELQKAGIDADLELGPPDILFQTDVQKKAWNAILVDDSSIGVEQTTLPVQWKECDLPLVLITRTSTEDAAIAALAEGFHDYVVRDNLKRLPAVLIREMRSGSLRRQLQQAQKLEAMGVLAGGIAHDFNNILAAIIGYSELSLDDLPEGSALRDNLDQILKASLRAKDLVQQILICSRRMENERQPLQVQLIVKEALKLLRSSFPSTIQIRTQFSGDGGWIMADPSQLHQVIMNLCTNAYQAMQELGGILTITLEDLFLNSSTRQLHPEFQDGAYTRLTVADTGQGMDLRTLERIFDPFFSTKPPSEGTGMGLAVVQSIVKAHRGVINVQSAPGKGSTFSLYFPRLVQSTSPIAAEKSLLPTGKGHILFVDDEEQIVHANRQMLERLGYQVTGTSSSLAALAAFRARPEKYQLVITDLTMPRMTGLELTRELRQIRPDVPVILCTGFSERATPEKIRELEINAFLTKPVISRELAFLLQKILQGGVPDGGSPQDTISSGRKPVE
jgi:signal transduction histidine kinase/CheY-like chemotaxis protein